MQNLRKIEVNLVNRRFILSGLIAAPAVIHASTLMRISDPKVGGIHFISGYGGEEFAYAYDKWVINQSFGFDYSGGRSKTVVPIQASRFTEIIKKQEKLGFKEWKYIYYEFS